MRKYKQVCVSKLLSAKKDIIGKCPFFMCLTDMNKFFEKKIYDL